MCFENVTIFPGLMKISSHQIEANGCILPIKALKVAKATQWTQKYNKSRWTSHQPLDV